MAGRGREGVVKGRFSDASDLGPRGFGSMMLMLLRAHPLKHEAIRVRSRSELEDPFVLIEFI